MGLQMRCNEVSWTYDAFHDQPVAYGALYFYGIPRKPVHIPIKASSVFVTNLVTIINWRGIR